MNILGSPRSLRLDARPQRIIVKNSVASKLLIQAQDGDVSYRLDGLLEAVDGFILPQNGLLEISVSSLNSTVTVWSTDKNLQPRVVIQDLK